jgi:very-short-patch-repair endonuclease
MTDAERKLWFALRDRRLAGTKFRRQVPIGPFIADFACYDARLIVEVDGGQHSESLSDERRDQWFSANGFRVLRFWNNDVLTNSDGVLQRVVDAVRATTPHPARAARGHPSSAREEGEGGRAMTARQHGKCALNHFLMFLKRVPRWRGHASETTRLFAPGAVR